MKYFIRSLKYFVALCVLCAAIMALNRLSGFATLTLEETFYVMFHTTRGMMLPAVIVLLATAALLAVGTRLRPSSLGVALPVVSAIGHGFKPRIRQSISCADLLQSITAICLSSIWA